MKIFVHLSRLAAVLLLAACASGPSKDAPAPLSSSSISEDGVPARVCLADQGPDRTLCVVFLGAERTRLADNRTVCSPVSSGDLADSYAVMDWIRAHPEAQGDDLSQVTQRVLQGLHPCT